MSARCLICGAELAPEMILYDEDGAAICQRCFDARQVAHSQRRVSEKVKAVAYGGVLLGLAGLVLNPLLLFSLAAIGSGVHVLRSLRDPQTAGHLAPSLEKIKVAAVAAMTLGGITAVLRLLLFLARKP